MTPSEFTNALDRGLWVPTNVGIFFVDRGGIFLLRRVKGDAAEVDIGTPVVFIRFNPDAYAASKKGKIDLHWIVNSSGEFVACDDFEWNSRLQKLKETILHHKTEIPSRHRCVRLFYDC